jgi:HK97 family phage major capsid protein
MKTITQYRSEIKALLDASADLDAKATAESRDLNEAEIEIKDDILNQVTTLKRTVETMEREENMRSALEKPEKPVSNPKPEKAATRIEAGDDSRSKDKFRSFGEQLGAIMNASIPGRGVDPRLFTRATGLGESVPSDGGFMVQTDFSTELLKQVWQTGILAQRCRRITLSGNANSIKINGEDETSRATGSRAGGIRGYWAAEADEKTASKPKFRQIELKLNKLIGLCYATDELLEDVSALEGYIRQGFASEFGFLIDDGIINGNGAGQLLGILNAGCLVSVGKEVGQDADTIVPENIVKMFARLFPSSRQNAVWLINQNVEPQLHLMGVGVGTGGQLVYMPPGGLSQAPYGTLLGRPVLPIEQCQTLGDQGDIILADLAGGYILAEKGGIQSDMSIHVKFIYDESVFRFVLRIDGQPVRASAVTPYKGGATNTLSHFVTLDERA